MCTLIMGDTTSACKLRNVLLFMTTLFVHNTYFIDTAPVPNTTFNTVTTVAMTTTAAKTTKSRPFVLGTGTTASTTVPISTRSPSTVSTDPPRTGTPALSASLKGTKLPSSFSTRTTALPVTSVRPSLSAASKTTPTTSAMVFSEGNKSQSTSTIASENTTKNALQNEAVVVTSTTIVPHTPLPSTQSTVIKVAASRSIPLRSKNKKIGCKLLLKRGIPLPPMCGNSSQFSGWN